VAISLAGDPDLLFLDEPTTGFDPAARRGAWQIVQNLEALGKTIFLTTHYMDEAQVLAKEVAVIAGGVIVAQGSPTSLGGRDTAATRVSFRLPPGWEMDSLPPSVSAVAAPDNGMVRLETNDPTRILHEVTGWALDRGIALEGLDVTRPTLEDVYLRLTGGQPGVEEVGPPEPARRRGRR
jgi:ABC-2 type transport system ATP-binding protein